MKKYLFIIVFAITAFMVVANVSAASINSQSVDVTVGEVDQISTDDENLDARTPDTGLFGLGSDGVGTVVATMIPAIIVLTCIFWHIYRKRTK
jgi:hypothetical protein